jgi:hypothetical protein
MIRARFRWVLGCVLAASAWTACETDTPTRVVVTNAGDGG